MTSTPEDNTPRVDLRIVTTIDTLVFPNADLGVVRWMQNVLSSPDKKAPLVIGGNRDGVSYVFNRDHVVRLEFTDPENISNNPA